MLNKIKIQLSLLGAIICWVLFVLTDIQMYETNEYYFQILLRTTLSLYIIFIFGYHRYVTAKASRLNFVQLLKKVFFTGLITGLISGSTQLFVLFLDNYVSSDENMLIQILYNIIIASLIFYVISTWVIWKRLILYQKTNNLLRLWFFFEVVLLIAFCVDFISYPISNFNFKIVLFIIWAFGFILSFQLKWVAYLTYKQKWISIFLMIISCLYLLLFFQILQSHTTHDQIGIDLKKSVFFWGITGFIVFYAFISILVTLFNLPTSSVFEQKLKQLLDFQRLSQTIGSDNSRKDIYRVLLESVMSATFANAAWLDVLEEKKVDTSLKNITYLTVKKIKSTLEVEQVQEALNFKAKKENLDISMVKNFKHPVYRSIFAIPIFIKGKQESCICLLHEAKDAFNQEMINIIAAFANQASISIENLALIKESIDNERYKEQLNIAKKVQISLLPKKLINNDFFEMDAFSLSADEVGGDFYDVLQVSDSYFSMIIGDVSGKGTRAAFQMAQMKGIFHSLANQKLGSKKFILQANRALSNCLELSSFITATFMDIDTLNKKISVVRAGHCPTLTYYKQSNKVQYLKSDGMGLGIIRNQTYINYVFTNSISYNSDDVLFLYTDGIIEARNDLNIEFGTDRLKRAFTKYATCSPKQIKEGIINDLKQFIGNTEINDDYTFMIIKFK